MKKTGAERMGSMRWTAGRGPPNAGIRSNSWWRFGGSFLALLLFVGDCGGQLINPSAITGENTRCCLKPDYGNDNSAPELKDCRQACRAFTPYSTLQSCAMNATCSNAVRDFNDAISLAVNVSLSATSSVSTPWLLHLITHQGQ